MKAQTQFRFGPFEADTATGDLRKHGSPVKLQQQPSKILAALLERPGDVVSREELVKRLWSDGTFVDYDRGLNAAVNRLRQALCDSAETPRYVETVARRGYRFIAPLETPEGITPTKPERSTPSRLEPWAWGAIAGTMLVVGVVGWWSRTKEVVPVPGPVPLTNFADSAIFPALSPDGRMLAFYRSESWFQTTDPIYVKLLPDGEPVQVTDDPRPKYGLAFSPGGSRIAYTVLGQAPPHWNTFTVSPFGDEPTLFLSNAAGLTWLDERELLFSEQRIGMHMGVVAATESRSEHRALYFPRNERGMAHFSYSSPDRRAVLVVEMDPAWQPCRIIPMDGSSEGRQVGPLGPCTSAAWSPDGKWMYFAAEVDGGHHLWRQRFPSGVPEQITFGPTEEHGVAVDPDGRSVITSIGLRRNVLWLHDAGERPLSSEGDVVRSSTFGGNPKFSRDGKSLFYLRRESPGAASMLWRTDTLSGRSENVVPEFPMSEFSLDSDGTEVVFSTQVPGEVSQIWLSALDRGSPPKLVVSSGGTSPRFGADGRILFRLTEGTAHYLAQMERDGSGASKVSPHPIANIQSVSPGGRWAVVLVPAAEGTGASTVALPVGEGSPRRICPMVCSVDWAPDGGFFYIGVEPGWGRRPGKTIAIPLANSEELPDIPASGIRWPEDKDRFPYATAIETNGGMISPGPDPFLYAYVKTTVQRNLFRISLPDD